MRDTPIHHRFGDHVIDRVRYLLGVFNVVVLPPGLLFWFVIHPWAHGWRRLGPTRTYLIVVPLVVAVGVVMLMFEERDLVNRFGEQYRQYQREVPQIIPRIPKTRRE